MIKLLFLLLFSFSLFAKTFSVATYNVENLFDLHHDKTEYDEFIPNKNNWNKQTLEIKLENLAQVINDLNADIVALQEVESKKALELLLQKIPQYPYYDFVKNPSSSVGVAIISKYKITQSKSIAINSKESIERPIQKVTVSVDNKELIIFNNHWRSKRSAESTRINYAMSLQNYLEQLKQDSDYILVGDFNSNYDEFSTFKYEKELNDSHNITGINHILNTIIDDRYITKENILKEEKRVHYNLWLELPHQQRFSSVYKNTHNTPDNILVSKGLFDSNNISYVNNSFKNFTPNYLVNNNKIQRWQMKKGVHIGSGYSDHLPIVASFSTSKYEEPKKKQKPNNISSLYDLESLDEPLILKDMVVIYKEGKSAVLKQKNDRAIYAYNCAEHLQLGYSYDLTIQELKNHFGLKEITQLKSLKKHTQEENIKRYYLDATLIDLFDLHYQNDIITNLHGVYENGYILLKSAQKPKIRLYAKDKTLLPKNGQNITIKSGHLGFYKSDVQIIIYTKSDIHVN